MKRLKKLIGLLANARAVHAEAKAETKRAYEAMIATIEGEEWLYHKGVVSIAKIPEVAATDAVRAEGIEVFERTDEKALPYGVKVKMYKRVDLNYNKEIDLRAWAFENMRGLLVLDNAKVKAAAEAGLLEDVVTVTRYLEPRVTIPRKLEVK